MDGNKQGIFYNDRNCKKAMDNCKSCDPGQFAFCKEGDYCEKNGNQLIRWDAPANGGGMNIGGAMYRIMFGVQPGGEQLPWWAGKCNWSLKRRFTFDELVQKDLGCVQQYGNENMRGGLLAAIAGPRSRIWAKRERDDDQKPVFDPFNPSQIPLTQGGDSDSSKCFPICSATADGLTDTIDRDSGKVKKRAQADSKGTFENPGRALVCFKACVNTVGGQFLSFFFPSDVAFQRFGRKAGLPKEFYEKTSECKFPGKLKVGGKCGWPPVSYSRNTHPPRVKLGYESKVLVTKEVRCLNSNIQHDRFLRSHDDKKTLSQIYWSPKSVSDFKRTFPGEEISSSDDERLQIGRHSTSPIVIFSQAVHDIQTEWIKKKGEDKRIYLGFGDIAECKEQGKDGKGQPICRSRVLTNDDPNKSYCGGDEKNDKSLFKCWGDFKENPHSGTNTCNGPHGLYKDKNREYPLTDEFTECALGGPAAIRNHPNKAAAKLAYLRLCKPCVNHCEVRKVCNLRGIRLTHITALTNDQNDESWYWKKDAKKRGIETKAFPNGYPLTAKEQELLKDDVDGKHLEKLRVEKYRKPFPFGPTADLREWADMLMNTATGATCANF